MDIEEQKKLTKDNKGWKFVKDYATEKKDVVGKLKLKLQI